MTKDYTLLRPFDLEAAKAGERCCDNQCCNEKEYIDGPDRYGVLVFLSNDSYTLSTPPYLRMKPLCWIEGKPVYKGDMVWFNDRSHVDLVGHCRIADSVYRDMGVVFSGGGWDIFDNLNIAKPKKVVKKKVKHVEWVNVYPDTTYMSEKEAFYRAAYAKALEDGADRCASMDIDGRSEYAIIYGEATDECAEALREMAKESLKCV